LPAPQDEIQVLSRLRSLNHAPGAEYSYSNEDYTLLGIIISRIAGMSPAEFAQRELFGPLGMKDTHYIDDAATVVKHRATNYTRKSDGTFELSSEEWSGGNGLTRERYPDGGISVMTSVEDMVKWDRNFADATVGGRVVIDAMQVDDRLNTAEPLEYGSGVYLQKVVGIQTVGHSGSGHGNRSIYARFPDQNVSVTIFCNWDSSPARLETVTRIAAIYGVSPKRNPSETQKPIELSSEQLEKFAGWYHSPITGALASVRAVPGGLGIKLGNFAESIRVPVSATEFRNRNNLAGAGLRFEGTRLLSPSTHEVWDKAELAPQESIKLNDYIGDWYSPDSPALRAHYNALFAGWKAVDNTKLSVAVVVI
jgi:hypothetical protein